MIHGLTSAEVNRKKTLGLTNQKIDSYSPSYLSIVRRNTFSLMNFVIIPLVILLYAFKLYNDATVFGVFVLGNTILNSFEEIRIKRRIEKLIQEFQQKTKVIRDGIVQEIPSSEVVIGDYIKAEEGEAIITDGKIVQENYLQIDESALTGESDYIKKKVNDQVLSGSFVVTGDCIYTAQKVGKQNYLNELGSKSLTYKKTKSRLEKSGDRFISFFVITGFIAALFHLFMAREGGASREDLLLSFTMVISIIIPQTLIFLYGLTFVISITKLANRGILVQKRGAIDDLAGIDTICIDKTGTITTNQMYVAENKYFNLKEELIGRVFNSASKLFYGKNKTSSAIENIYATFETIEFSDFDQIPFTSRNKYSAFSFFQEDTKHIVFLGAPTILLNLVEKNLKIELENHVKKQEDKGFRVIILLYSTKQKIELNNIQTIEDVKQVFDSAACFSIQENLNPGIKEILKQLREQEIDVKVISGDSYKSVSDIAQKIGFPNPRIIDVSQTNERLERLALEYNIFTRAKPEDKLVIIKTLRENGHKVAMIGDGINDVLSMKQSTVSIAMENGAKIARDVADIVLLQNDYKKVPQIFYEGDNIVFNLKLTTKIFYAKAFMGFVIAGFFALLMKPIPILPSTSLIFSFFGGTFISYVVSFSRQQVKNQTDFTKNIIATATPSGIFMGLSIILMYLINKSTSFDLLNSYLVMGLLSVSLVYAIYLLWEAEKINSIKFMLFVWIIGMFYGMLLINLPIYSYNEVSNKVIGLLGLIITSSIFFTYIVYKISSHSANRIKYAIVLGLAHFLVLMIFPFKYYYQAEPINKHLTLDIVLVTALFSIIMLILHRIFKFFGN